MEGSVKTVVHRKGFDEISSKEIIKLFGILNSSITKLGSSEKNQKNKVAKPFDSLVKVEHDEGFEENLKH